MKKIPMTVLTSTFTMLVMMGLFFVPLAVQAATNDPSCSLYYINNGVVTETKSSARIQVAKNNFVGLIWNGINVTSTVDSDNKPVPSLGAQIIIPTRDETYSYTFSQGVQNVTCSLDIKIISGSISNKSTAKSNERFTITGKVEGVKNVAIAFYKMDATTPEYTTKAVALKNEKFSFKMTTALDDGMYRVVLQTTDAKPVELATSTITVGKPKAIAQTNLVLQTIPLLTGGVVKAGSGVAVAYLQVINIGANPAHVTGFTFTQNGSAPTTAIVGVSMTDERGLAKGSVGNMLTDTPFVGGTVVVPVPLTLAPKESRLFTVRAVVGANAIINIGQTMSLSLKAVTGNFSIQSVLPRNNVTWTIGL